jgi:hypothetical protein
VLIASYLWNRTPIGPNRKTPEEAYTGKCPYIGHLRAYRCVVYAHVPKEKRLKLEDIAVKTCFIGYMPTSKQYKLYEPESGDTIISIAPEFHENERLENNWNEVLLGEETVLFNPMVAMGTPKAPVITGPIEGISGSPAPNSPVFDP